MIETAAKAMFRQHYPSREWEGETDTTREIYLKQARAALTALDFMEMAQDFITDNMLGKGTIASQLRLFGAHLNMVAGEVRHT